MAYETLATYNIYEWEQEETTEIKSVVNEDGEVIEEETLLQEYAHIKAEIIVKQERDITNNRSYFRAELWCYATAGKKGDGFTLDLYDDCYLKLQNIYTSTNQPNLKFGQFDFTGIPIKPGETRKELVRVFDSTDDILEYTTPVILGGEHNLDGSFSYLNKHYPSSSSGVVFDIAFNFYGYFKARTRYLLYDGKNKSTDHEVTTEALYPTAFPIDRKSVIVMADNFTDEHDAALLYSASPGYNIVVSTGEVPYKYIIPDEIELQVALSFDGTTPDIEYKTISATSDNYAFDFTEAERQLLRTKAQGSINVPIYYLLKTTRTIIGDNVNQSMEFITVAKRTLTIVGAEPSLDPYVWDEYFNTVALTGDSSKIIRYASVVGYQIGATASKQAEIVHQSIKNGSQMIENSSQGFLYNPESNTFYFAATDSRGLTARDFIVVDLIPYVIPTAKITKAYLDTEGVLTFSVSGNYYNDSFGAKNNTIQFEYSIRENDGDISWHIIEPEVKYNQNNTYSFNYTITGLNYLNTYILEINIIDEIQQSFSEPKIIASIPVYDWGKEDFRHHTNVYMDNNTNIYGLDTQKNNLQLLGVNSNNETVLGKGSFDEETGSTNIYGNNININYNNSLNINGKQYGSNRVLWSGASHMNGNQSINLSEAISEQANGIVLVFSLYRDNAAENVSINSFFVSKYEIAALGGSPHSFFMLINAGFSTIGAKYLYINDDSISGHEGNTNSGSNNGIAFSNSNFVLRYVIGV